MYRVEDQGQPVRNRLGSRTLYRVEKTDPATGEKYVSWEPREPNQIRFVNLVPQVTVINNARETKRVDLDKIPSGSVRTEPSLGPSEQSNYLVNKISDVCRNSNDSIAWANAVIQSAQEWRNLGLPEKEVENFLLSKLAKASCYKCQQSSFCGY